MNGGVTGQNSTGHEIYKGLKWATRKKKKQRIVCSKFCPLTRITLVWLRIGWPLGWNFSMSRRICLTEACSESTIRNAVRLTKL